MNQRPPFLTYEAIQKVSEIFLKEHHPSGELPIPIEEIVEFELGIDIVPIPGLYRSVSVNGFLTSDMRCIYVDQTQYEQYEQKYRFTIAHEVGHLVLHKGCYEGVNYTNLDEFLVDYGSIDGIDMGWFETQASWFAELVLVPTEQLREICTHVVRDRAHDIRRVGGLTGATWSYLANDIARPFNVSPAVVECRIGRAGMRDS
jgi:Zn-dependent peptidase ImmA (M78 family)